MPHEHSRRRWPGGAPALPAGLSEAEARSRLLAEGPNELPSERRNSFVEGVLGVLREPMLLLLAGAAALYFVLGDVVEASILLFMVGVVFGITWVQERKTERALVALRDLTSPRANVIREGKRRRVPGHEVVRGDVVMLAEGDRVPADAVVRDATNLSVEESILTGESAPVRKVAAVHGKAPSDASPGGDALPFVFSGTLVVRGHGVVEVTATGGRTALGRVGMSLREIETERTPLEREVARAVRVVASLGALACVVLVVAYGISRGEWLEGLLAGIAFAMAILPEEMPMILAVFPALGAWRISKEGVLTRRTAAIEALGATTVLCTDKTGTLTENRMRIAELRAHGLAHAVGDDPLPEAVHEVVEFGILASQRDPFDPMEIAFHSIGVEKLSGTEHLHSSWELVREYPLEPPLLSISHVWRAPEGKRFVVAAKGAPETIVDLCHLPDEERAAVTAEVRELATKGLRVLAVARAYFEPGPLPESQHDFAFRMVGLVGLEDPIRAEVPAAVAECRGAGIRVVMITGDYAETARAVAERAGFSHIDIVTGAELDALDDEALGERVRTANVYVRVIPEQKLRVVRALEAGGDVVAMTGDGVNDAPALKAAHIGVAMGGRGTDVAREASALVLTNDDFASLVAAVRLGRRIYANLEKAMAYVLAVHVPIAGIALLPVFFGWPLAFLPVHIVFIEMIIDPACSIVFEAEPAEPRTMERPPRGATHPLFSRRMILTSVVQGLVVLGAVFGIYAWSLPFGERIARTLTFSAFLAANVGLIFVTRSRERSLLSLLRARNVAAWAVAGAASAVLVLVLWVRPLRELFRFEPVSLAALGGVVAAGFLSAAWFEIVKFARRQRGNLPGSAAVDRYVP